MRLARPVALLAALSLATPAAHAQQIGAVVPGPATVRASPILTINEAALFGGSAWGQRVQAELERRSRELSAENDRSYDELSAQEEELTALRATLSPEEFRARAEAFDTHAESVRAERQAALRALNDFAEGERNDFFDLAVPIFAEIMAERGALVILDQRMVFVSADAVDVTQALIDRIDARIGAGPLNTGTVENPPEPEDLRTEDPGPEGPAPEGGAD